MPIEDIQIRKLTGDDAAIYREIRIESLKLCPEAFSVTLEAESSQSLEWFAGRLANSDVVGGFHGETIVGMAGLLVHQGNCAHSARILGVYVKEGFRSIGLGRRLMEAIIDIARERVELIQLSCLVDNEPARRLYTSLGFQQYGLERKSHKIAGRYYDQVLMVKDLTS